ncbi:fimbrial protein, partial [Providencia manganoxydans]
PALSTPYLTYINDYGGKPTLAFRCQGDTCTVTGEQ